DPSAAFGLVVARRPGRQARVGLFSQRGQHRHHEREDEEHDDGHGDDRPVIRVQAPEAHAGILTAAGADAGNAAGWGRMAQTLTAKTTWLPTIKRPPIVRQSHIGSASITETMKDCPATHARPWRTPAVEIAIT